MITVFTNGCFDILHVGHVKLLEYCKKMAGKKGRVIVGLNSDSSVKQLKGKDRPYNKEQDRKKILEALKCVDEVIIFKEKTPFDLIRKIKPNILVKGGDYDKVNVVGGDLVSVVKIFSYADGYSTSNTLKKIKNAV
jgi:D-beta-D-heptose 7-phosphate kinase/D-beta-D-heptose 1-phosphate adenosyltransferase